MPSTPTANIPSTCLPSPQSLSRRSEHDAQASRSHSTAPSPEQAHPPSQLAADLTSHNSTQGPSHHSPPERDVSTERPTKRQRKTRQANMTAERASSSSGSSSQSGMADNETEAERSQQSELAAQQAAAPPKKKRTRTLTTPHQSAVLHALLAKSRFPNTVQREEVGRQIGLSARKVQIWFQNQRQKARRPQTESAPLTRPPQFGPFPTMMLAGPSSASYPAPSTAGPVSPSGPSSTHSPGREPRGSLDSNPVLSGPGMPGWSPQRGPSSAEEWEQPRRVPTSPEGAPVNLQHPLPPRPSEGVSPRESRGPTRTFAPPPPAQATQVEASPRFSRTLPPLNLSTLGPRDSIESYVSAASFPPQPPSRSVVNVVQRHDVSARPAAEPSSPRSRNLPPPFALQPQPQWDPHTFSPYTRPEFASWSQASGSSLSSARSSFSADGAHDRVAHNVSPSRRFYPPAGDPQRAAPLDPLSHHIMSPRGRRLSTSAPCARASLSGDVHARLDHEAGEDS